MSEMKTPWGGRFSKSPDAFATEFGASLPVDRRMWEEDVRASSAHAKMLAAQGIISAEDADRIQAGLARIHKDIRSGAFEFVNADEDIHMAIERALIGHAGPAGGRLHTARSRNDQVATDTRMYAKRAAAGLADGMIALRATLLRLADEHPGAVMPGYTHLQRAQPVLLAHHLLAYTWMFARDTARLRHAYDAADSLPLGAGALAGTTYPIDRHAVAGELGFADVMPNSLDAVSDRDFLLDLVYACSVAMVHLSRLCEELVLWSSGEFGFVRMDDAFATGSSMMPQKRNPDVAELVRGKTGRVIGDLTALLVTLKGLPLAYNKDMQEDKPAAFDAIDTLADCVHAVDGMIGTMSVDADAMRAAASGGYTSATDLADHLVAQGVPFREAHEVVGGLVASCEKSGSALQDLSLEQLREADGRFGDDALAALDMDAGVARRSSEGGTSPQAVSAQMDLARSALEADRAWSGSVGQE